MSSAGGGGTSFLGGAVKGVSSLQMVGVSREIPPPTRADFETPPSVLIPKNLGINTKYPLEQPDRPTGPAGGFARKPQQSRINRATGRARRDLEAFRDEFEVFQVRNNRFQRREMEIGQQRRLREDVELQERERMAFEDPMEFNPQNTMVNQLSPDFYSQAGMTAEEVAEQARFDARQARRAEAREAREADDGAGPAGPDGPVDGPMESAPQEVNQS